MFPRDESTIDLDASLARAFQYLSGNKLYVNPGEGDDPRRFASEEGTRFEPGDRGWGWDAAFFDYENDGDWDMEAAVEEYVELSEEEEFDAGLTPEITTGIVTRLLAKGRARRAAAKVREGRPVTRSRDDYALEAAQLRERVQRLEHHIESLAQAADNEEVKALILEVLQ